jgi:hypothetical protein
MRRRYWGGGILHWILFEMPGLESWNPKNLETWKPEVGILKRRSSGFQLRISRFPGFQASRLPNLFSRRPNPIQHISHPQERKRTQQEIAISA